jgi:serine/threonine protein kinase
MKPENLLLVSKTDDEHVKLADFGFAARINRPGDQNLQDYCGTPGYMAPEIIKNQPHGLCL